MKMNNRGYTILATLVGLVLVSLSARALLSLTQSSLKSGLAMDRMSAVPRLAGNLELILRDHASCANALKVKHASGNTENSYFHPAVKASQKGVINKIVFQGDEIVRSEMALGDSRISEISLIKKGTGTPVTGTVSPQLDYDSELVVKLVGKDGALSGAYKQLKYLLSVRVEEDSSSPGKENIISCQRQVAGGNVVVVPDPVGSQYDYKCQAMFDMRPLGEGTDDHSTGSLIQIKRKCPSPNQVITSCTAILYPNGERVCGTTPMVGRDPADGLAWCSTFDCTAGGSSEQWGVNYSCCEIVKK